VTNITRK